MSLQSADEQFRAGLTAALERAYGIKDICRSTGSSGHLCESLMNQLNFPGENPKSIIYREPRTKIAAGLPCCTANINDCVSDLRRLLTVGFQAAVTPQGQCSRNRMLFSRQMVKNCQ